MGAEKNNTTSHIFSQVLKDYRKKHNLTQKQLAELVGISVLTVKNYEAGEYREPTLNSLCAFPVEVIEMCIVKYRETFNLTKGVI